MNDTQISSELYNELLRLGILVLTDGKPHIGEEFRMGLSLGFDDVAIRQNKNVVQSRLDVDISSYVCGVKLDVPLISANMSTVTDVSFCIAMNRLGGLGILHRAYDDDDEYVNDANRLYNFVGREHAAASVGVGERQLELAKALIDVGVGIICVDVAHGYSQASIDMARAIKRHDRFVKVIAGNTTNVDALREFAPHVDALKVGIAQGLACETKNTAGCTERQFSAVLKFKEEARRSGVTIISDGGVREPADFVKAMAAGASAVMAGSVFARCPSSPAPLVDGMKLYAGMASRYVQERWKGGIKDGTCPEGKVVMLPIGEPISELMDRYAGALRSGMTYAGASNVVEFHDRAEFVRIR